MPGFLSSFTNRCCCPEMRCCAPETVAASVSGFQGTLVPEWVNIVNVGIPPLTSPIANLEIGFHPCAFEVAADPGCTAYTTTEFNATTSQVEFTADAIYPVCMAAQIVWPAMAFPQQDVTITTSSPAAGHCLSGQGVYFDAFVTNATAAEICDGELAALLCEKPDDQTIYYGPAGHRRVYQADFNNTYVCHRYDVWLRPEFAATVNRSAEAAEDAAEARLAFDVYCRRTWQFSAPCNAVIILNLSCAVSDDPPEDPPEGNFYCIDYRCGPRMDDVAEGGSLCDQHKCTAHEGTVWPHLFAYPPDDNYTATVKLRLTPDAYFTYAGGYSYQGAKPAKPMTWIVAEATATEPGEDYEVGQFFTVDFDQAFLGTLGGGEVNIALPAVEPECGFPVTWEDDYGQQAEEVGDALFYYQRLRVEEVNGNGGIVRLSVVPWYQTPEYRADACGVEITSKAQKRKRYPPYTRFICHPNSVDIGGEGYSIGDSITFTPTSPGVVTYAATIAEVVDVDDDGAVLDWEVKGSDIWRYGFGGGNPTCDIIGQPDERGAYKWEGVYLCDLRWHGIGVPVRATSPATDSFLFVDYWTNNGRLTEVEVSISRVPCRTTISVELAQYAYETLAFLANADNEEATLFDRCLKICPPYPRCVGGGAQIMPVIGDDGANESAIGGPLDGGDVKSGGGYYAFVDKSHAEPILPTVVPAIGSGSGAVIGAFTFGQVLDFPTPGYADGQKLEPSATRFAYFPVTAATIAQGGTGYAVGQEFDAQPVGGSAYLRAWTKDGGDNPDRVPNGSWYSGELAQTDEDGYVVRTGGSQRASVARLRVKTIGDGGAITELEVLHGGMMFRPVWASGIRHPDVEVRVGSDTGYGASATVTIDALKTSTTFGEVTACQVVAIPVEQLADPLHSTEEDPVAYPLGGRDYANPESGQMWELGNITVGSGLVGGASMLCKVDWHTFIYNAYHPAESTHDLIEGSNPPFHRRAEACSLDECYHGLLNRTYPLFRIWTNSDINKPSIGLNTQNRVDGSWEGCLENGPNGYSPFPTSSELVDGRPPNDFGVYRTKGKRTDVYLPPIEDPTDPAACIGNQRIDQQEGYEGLPSAGVDDYVVVEWGFNITLSATAPEYPDCPDQENGRTAE